MTDGRLVNRTLGAYEILERLGAGGMGEVYKARHTRLNRLAAVKVLPPGRAGDQELRRRFFHEAQAASALNHPNIVTIYDVDSAGDVDFIAMELVPGRTLEQILSEGRLSVAHTLHYARQIVGALEKAHGAGIVHRDLKPGNIMITESGLVKLLDFGLAKWTAAAPGEEARTNTLEGSIVGTVSYMSPEQAEGKPVDARSDLFSLGAVLYEMLTGRRAFSGHSAISTLTAVLRDNPTPVAEISQDVPPEIEQAVMRCLRKNPRLRFQSVAELGVALTAHVPPPAASAPASAPAPSIAVLPFANLSGDPENDYFGDGLAEEILNALTRLPNLKVAARTSAFRFRGAAQDIRQVGEQLKVSSVLEGSVRRAGNRVRVTTQLVNVADGFHLWSERFDRELTDIFAIQDEISQAVVDRLRVNLAASGPLVKPGTPNLEAYTALLEGRFHHQHFTLEGIRKARSFYERAISLDPAFAPAYAALADFHSNLAILGFADPAEVMPQALALVRRSLELDSAGADAHSTLGILLAAHEHDWPAAQSAFRRSIELNPASALGRLRYSFWLLRPLGHLDEALAESEKALELDPLSPYARVIHCFLAYYQRRYSVALERSLRVLEIDPNYYWAHLLRAFSCARLGAADEAAAAAVRMRELLGAAPLAVAARGVVDALAGRPDQARAAAAELESLAQARYVSPQFLAWLYANLGEADAAFGWLQTGYSRRDPWVISLHTDPLLEPLRGDARFGALLAELGLQVS